MGIYDWPVDLTYKEIVEICKEKNIAIVRYIVGRRQPLIFCNEKCYNEWKEKNSYEERNGAVRLEREISEKI